MSLSPPKPASLTAEPPPKKELTTLEAAGIRAQKAVRYAAIGGGAALMGVTTLTLMHAFTPIGVGATALAGLIGGSGVLSTAATGLFLGVPAGVATLGGLYGATSAEADIHEAQTRLTRAALQDQRHRAASQRREAAGKQMAMQMAEANEAQREEMLGGLQQPAVPGLSGLFGKARGNGVKA